MAAERSGTEHRAYRNSGAAAWGPAPDRSAAIGGAGDPRSVTAYLPMEMDAAGGVLSCR